MTHETPDPILFGQRPEPGLVAVEQAGSAAGAARMALFWRREGKTVRTDDPFQPFLLADPDRLKSAAVDLDKAPAACRRETLGGANALRLLLLFETWKGCAETAKWMGKALGAGAGDPAAPFLFLNDPVRQYLMLSGRTQFHGLEFEDLRRMQVDIECTTTEGYEFCNADREGDRIVAIALADQTGWVEVLSGEAGGEKGLIETFVQRVTERDPDVIEGHNVFNFDLPYLAARAKRHGVPLALGRDGSAPRVRASRLPVGDRTVSYSRFEIFGRHVVDTLFLVQAYDLSERSLESFGLKEVAVHFGLAAADRTYIEGSAIAEEFRRDPAKVLRYVRDDVSETRALGALLSRSYFVQARILPHAYQDVCVRGNATKIDSLIVREYLRRRHSVSLPDAPRPFEGGYTDMFERGVIRDVHHCDVRSLYPSLMLARRIGPRSDELGVFHALLETLTRYRLEAKARMSAARDGAERTRLDALQRTFKILVNSFYGYLGFARGQFSDFDAAERVTADGRALIQSMIERLRKQGARPVEIDTDGIYYVPPAFKTKADLEAFRAEFSLALPKGIEVEFDGEYQAMFSYKMKNYALLGGDGTVTIRGAALKSRGLEPFQRSFLRDAIRLRLEGREKEVALLKADYEKAIRNHEWPVSRLAKTVTLQDSPDTYAAKIGEKSRGRDAAYELALKSGREYRAGDQLSFYITGNRKSVTVYENARLAAAADPARRDENVPYYLAKLDALHAKLYDTDSSDSGQEELNL